MKSGSHARPTEASPRRPRTSRLSTREAPSSRSRWLWRIGTSVMILLCGGLFAVSAANSEGTDLRPGRYTDLASLVRNDSETYDALKGRVAELTADVARLTASIDDREVNRYRRKVEKLKDPAGLVPRSGPGVTVTLSDAPEDIIASTSQDLNLLLVHQQDIQAVVNAMWKGGASAVTIQGQRVVSTTGIKCSGNTVTLQGVPYPQPYVISAVGNVDLLNSAIENDDYLAIYRQYSEIPDVALGWDVKDESEITAPAYDGLLSLNYAEPLS